MYRLCNLGYNGGEIFGIGSKAAPHSLSLFNMSDCSSCVMTSQLQVTEKNEKQLKTKTKLPASIKQQPALFPLSWYLVFGYSKMLSNNRTAGEWSSSWSTSSSCTALQFESPAPPPPPPPPPPPRLAEAPAVWMLQRSHSPLSSHLHVHSDTSSSPASLLPTHPLTHSLL